MILDFYSGVSGLLPYDSVKFLSSIFATGRVYTTTCNPDKFLFIVDGEEHILDEMLVLLALKFSGDIGYNKFNNMEELYCHSDYEVMSEDRFKEVFLEYCLL